MNDEEAERIVEMAMPLFSTALSKLLKPSEGVILHYEDHGYAVWFDQEAGMIKVQEDDDYLMVEDGTLVWMHYEGSSAPEPLEGDTDLRPFQTDDGNITKH